MLFTRTGLLTVWDPKVGRRQETSTKSGGICGSLAGTDPHCSTWILGLTQFSHWIPGIGSLRDWLLQKQAQLLPAISCLYMIDRDSHSLNLRASHSRKDVEDWPRPGRQGVGLESQHSLCQLPSCGRILLPGIRWYHTINWNNTFGVILAWNCFV